MRATLLFNHASLPLNRTLNFIAYQISCPLPTFNILPNYIRHTVRSSIPSNTSPPTSRPPPRHHRHQKHQNTTNTTTTTTNTAKPYLSYPLINIRIAARTLTPRSAPRPSMSGVAEAFQICCCETRLHGAVYPMMEGCRMRSRTRVQVLIFDGI